MSVKGSGRRNIAILVALTLVLFAGIRALVDTERGGQPHPPAKPEGQRPPAAARPDYGPLQEEIKAFLATRPATFGIYFKDLETGSSFGINETEPIQAASTRKVPLILYLNDLAARGEIDLKERVAYRKEEDYQGGAGALQFFARDGDTYSLRALATLIITLSDNVATNMLLRRLGREKVAAFMRAIGGQTVFPEGKNVTTARDMGVYMEAVLDFARRHPDLGNRMLDDLAHSIWHFGLPGELPSNLIVAHKEGDVVGVADDVGVVFSRRPFILCVLSKGVEGTDEGFRDIARITRMVYDFQEGLAGGTR